MAYICTYRGARALQFDPRQGTFRDFGRQGEGIARTIAADKRYVYTVVARTGSETDLVALDLQTERREVLRTFSGWFVLLEPDAVHPNRLTLTRQDEQRGVVSEYYTVHDKHIAPVAGGSPSPAPQECRIHPRGGGERPVWLSGSALCAPDGVATLWFRNPREAWQSVSITVTDRPSTLFRMGTFGDGKLVLSSNDPYTIVQWDPAIGRRSILGLTPNNTHVYAFAGLGGRGYLCGYSGAPLLEWDPGRPWTVRPPLPDVPQTDWTGPLANPRVCHRGDLRRAYDLAAAADGRLYVACGAYLEREPGGALKIHSPRTGITGLAREGFEVHAPARVCAASEGRRLVVFSMPRAGAYQDYVTGRTEPPPQGFLLDQRIDTYGGRAPRRVPWDPESYVTVFAVPPRDDLPLTQRARFVPVPGMRALEHPGELVEWKPGLVVGRCVSPRLAGGRPAYPGANETTFFLVDAEEGRSLGVRLRLPGAPAPRGLLRLSDGRLLSLHGGAAHVVDPESWTARELGKFDCPVTACFLLGEDLYLLSGTSLRRVRAFVETVVAR